MTDAWNSIGGGLIYRPICLTDGGNTPDKEGREGVLSGLRRVD